MSIGINWAEIWKDVWKDVWTQTAPVPPVVATPAEFVDPGAAPSGGVGTAPELREARERRAKEAVEAFEQAEIEAEAAAQKLQDEILAAQALAEAEEAANDGEAFASTVEYLRATPPKAPPPPPAVHLSAKFKVTATLKAKAPTLEAVLKASIKARVVVIASLGLELPLQAQVIAQAGMRAVMHLEVEDDALALVLGAPELAGEIGEFIRIS